LREHASVAEAPAAAAPQAATQDKAARLEALYAQYWEEDLQAQSGPGHLPG
jgi:hypothetical protein